MHLFAVFGLGPVELLIVAGVVLLLFGTRLPKVMRSAGHIEGRAPTQRRPARALDDEPVATVATPRFEPPAAADA